MIGNQGVNIITNHSMQLGIIVLSFAFSLTGIKKDKMYPKSFHC